MSGNEQIGRFLGKRLAFNSDLNAMHEAEMSLPEKDDRINEPDRQEFRIQLGIVCGSDQIAHATAAQRAQAFLRMLQTSKSSEPKMKTSETLAAFAQDHARSFIRGTKTAQDILTVVKAMRSGSPAAAAVYVLEIASCLPDSLEVELRKIFADDLNATQI